MLRFIFFSGCETIISQDDIQNFTKQLVQQGHWDCTEMVHRLVWLDVSVSWASFQLMNYIIYSQMRCLLSCFVFVWFFLSGLLNINIFPTPVNCSWLNHLFSHSPRFSILNMIKGNRSDFPEVLPKYVCTDACSKNVETVFNRGVLIRIQHGDRSVEEIFWSKDLSYLPLPNSVVHKYR